MDYTIPSVPPQKHQHARQKSLQRAAIRVDATSHSHLTRNSSQTRSQRTPSRSASSSSDRRRLPLGPPPPPPVFNPRSDSLSYRYTGNPPSGRTNNSTLLVAPASPDVLNSLIDSFAVIQKPSDEYEYSDGPSLRPSPHLSPSGPFSAPLASPASFRDGFPSPSGHSHLHVPEPTLQQKGSFGVDYGAFRQPSKEELRAAFLNPLEDLSAAPPIIKTSKPPSGYSNLTAPKSLSHKDSSGGLRALLRSGSRSRPSSRSSNCSRDDHSIGAISVDRSGTPDLHRSRSTDSWGRASSTTAGNKAGNNTAGASARNHRGLMYMSSKERLRETEREREKKRASFGTSGVGGGMNFAMISSPEYTATSPGLRPSAPLAEIPITEEPLSPVDDSDGGHGFHLSSSPIPPIPAGDIASPRNIPTRESSLRRTPGARRSSARNSRSSSARDHSYDGERERDRERDYVRDIQEHVDKKPGRSNSAFGRHRRSKSSLDGDIGGKRGVTPDSYGQSYGSTGYHGSGRESPAVSSGRKTPLHRRVSDSFKPKAATVSEDGEYHHAFTLDDEGAPFPAVAQNRRREDEMLMDKVNRRRSGRFSTDAAELKMKRSSSRLKRLSASGLSSRTEDGVPSAKEQKAREKEERKRASSVDMPERPQSADSIDDAVESYLCSNRLSQKIRHPQTGRIISFSEVGDPEGSAVFCCVGMGLTRYITAFYDELALTLKLRLITPDRPGVGESEAYNDGTTTPLSWPDDVYAICQSLRITKFSILAHSAGAIYALATALRMPQHIRGRIHLLAPWIPPSQMNVFGTSQALPPTNAIPTAQRILRALPTPFLNIANSSFMTATSSSITSSLPRTPRRKARRSAANAQQKIAANFDKENVPYAGKMVGDMGDGPPENGSPEGPDSNTRVLTAAFDALADKERQAIYDERLTHSIWELATTGANPAVDLLVCLERRHQIGFRYVDITRPVVIHHGSRDTRVPVDNVRWLGKTMRRCEVRVLEGEGHGLMASAQVMGGVLMEIAKEWDDVLRLGNDGLGPGTLAGTSRGRR